MQQYQGSPYQMGWASLARDVLGKPSLPAMAGDVSLGLVFMQPD